MRLVAMQSLVCILYTHFNHGGRWCAGVVGQRWWLVAKL
jgi:hypothetical protein